MARRVVATKIGAVTLAMLGVTGTFAFGQSAGELHKRGLEWSKSRQFHKAIADISESIRLDPTEATPYLDRAMLWIATEEYDKALADFGEAIRINPKLEGAFRGRAFAWVAKSELDEAIDDLDGALRLDPKNHAALTFRGSLWLTKGDAERAVADFDEAIRLGSRLPDTFANRAGAWMLQEDYDKAIADYDEAIRIEPNKPLPHYYRGCALEEKSHFARAIADFNETLRLDPGHAGAWAERAWIWATCRDATHRDGKKAIHSAAKACELSTWQNAEYLDVLAASHAEVGNFVQAVIWEEEALKLTTPGSEDDRPYQERLILYRERRPFHRP